MPLGSSGLAYMRGSVGGSFNRSASLQVQTPFGTITRSSDTSFALAYGASTGLNAARDRVMLGVETSLLYMRPAFEAENQQGDINSI